MKFTLNWLRDHLDTTASLDDICATLTSIGLEVEEVQDRSAALLPFVAAEIMDAHPHPDADKLQVCRVNNGQEDIQIVCGAPNARAGIKVVLAPVGTIIPSNAMVIRKSAIRGVESVGMLCSASELSLGTDSDGIMELPANTNVGEPFATQMGIDDPIIEIAITPDRADCLGVRGIARDLAAAGLGTLKPLSVPEITKNGESSTHVTINDGTACSQFIGCTISGVTNAPSPDWVQQRLQAVGQKCISALVDVTNYISIDLGRPLHVFDADKLNGNITVRPANDGEKMCALDEETYELPTNTTVIADDAGAQGIGGIMGGFDSGCQLDTKNVFLEVAYFDPPSIATTGRRLRIDSDARYRFERGVDPQFLPTATDIAIGMIQQLCGGQASNLVSAGQAPATAHSITFRPERVAALGGHSVSEAEMERILTALGFTIEQSPNHWLLTVPSWRGDVHGEADIIEEILRIVGLDNIKEVPLPSISELPNITLSLQARRMKRARELAAHRGSHEVRSWAFTSTKQTAQMGFDVPESLQLANPIHAEMDGMRPSLLLNLLSAVKRSHERGFSSVHMHEIGWIYHNTSPTGQEAVASMVRTGHMNAQHWSEKPRAIDAFDAKADAQALLKELGAPVDKLQTMQGNMPAYFHPGRSAALCLGPKMILAYAGELHPECLKIFGIKGRVVACEIFIDKLPQKEPKALKPPYHVSDLQPVTRDFSFIIPERMAAGSLAATLAKADKKLISNVEILSIFADDALKAEQKLSLALRVTLQPTHTTLTEDDIDAVSAAIIKTALKQQGLELSDALKHYVNEKGLAL